LLKNYSNPAEIKVFTGNIMWITVDKPISFTFPTDLKYVIPISTALIVIGYFLKNII